MHHLLAGLLGSLLLRGALAQFGAASKPFALVVESSNSTLNGSLLLACHVSRDILSSLFHLLILQSRRVLPLRASVRHIRHSRRIKQTAL